MLILLYTRTLAWVCQNIQFQNTASTYLISWNVLDNTLYYALTVNILGSLCAVD